MTDALNSSNQETPQDALDRALDAMVRGDNHDLSSLDAEMQTTVAHLFALADLAGLPSETNGIPSLRSGGAHLPPSRGARPGLMDRKRATPATVTSLRPANDHKMRRILMSTLSGLAAAMLIGLGIYGAIPLFGPDHDPEPTSIAFRAVDGTPEATTTADVPPDVIYTGNTPISNGSIDFVPPQGTVLTGVNNSDARYPVSPEECLVKPRSREEVLKILGTAPGAAASELPKEYDQSDIEEPTLTELQALYREWQACRRFGLTYQAMALETDQLIRNDIYGTGGYLSGRSPQKTAFSEATLNELLDAREGADKDRQAIGAERSGHNPGAEDGLLMHLWVIDTSQMLPGSSEETYNAGSNGGNWIQVPVVWQSPNTFGDPAHPLPLAYVNFVNVDGQWKISDIYVATGPSMDSNPNAG
ncbi:MAG: hypothetical protein ACR2OU_18200 [Thermomicrobiales bacterium]